MGKYGKQHPNQGGSLDFNGQNNGEEHGVYDKKYQYNQHTGKPNEGALINKGRGPTVAGRTGKTAGPVTAKGKEQYRGVGGTEVKCPANYDKINVGRGPTVGNSKPGGKV